MFFCCFGICPCTRCSFPSTCLGGGVIFIHTCSSEVYLSFKRRIHVLYQFWKILSPISSCFCPSFAQFSPTEASKCWRLVLLPLSHVSSLCLSMLYLGDILHIRFSNPLALLIGLWRSKFQQRRVSFLGGLLVLLQIYGFAFLSYFFSVVSCFIMNSNPSVIDVVISNLFLL